MCWFEQVRCASRKAGRWSGPTTHLWLSSALPSTADRTPASTKAAPTAAGALTDNASSTQPPAGCITASRSPTTPVLAAATATPGGTVSSQAISRNIQYRLDRLLVILAVAQRILDPEVLLKVAEGHNSTQDSSFHAARDAFEQVHSQSADRRL